MKETCQFYIKRIKGVACVIYTTGNIQPNFPKIDYSIICLFLQITIK